MNETQLFERCVIDYTLSQSNFDERRTYLSLSHALDDVMQLCKSFKNGYEANETLRLKCYKGYQMQRDLVNRIVAALPGRIDTEKVCQLSELSKGHPDFFFLNDDGVWIPGDCKSVLMDEWIPQNGRVSKKVYWQMQAYMLASNTHESVVVFESRESGLIKCVSVRADIKVMHEIKRKFQEAEQLILA